MLCVINLLSRWRLPAEQGCAPGSERGGGCRRLCRGGLGRLLGRYRLSRSCRGLLVPLHRAVWVLRAPRAFVACSAGRGSHAGGSLVEPGFKAHEEAFLEADGGGQRCLGALAGGVAAALAAFDCGRRRGGGVLGGLLRQQGQSR